MYISSRLLKVIEFLKERNESSIKEISESLNITERMVRYDVDTLNFILRMYKISGIQKESRGKLIISNEFRNNSKLNDIKNFNKYSKAERVEFLKAKLLIEGSLNLSALSKSLDVSRTSIRNDVVQVALELSEDDISIENNSIKKDEKEIRAVIMKNYSKDFIKFKKKGFKDEETSLLQDYLSQSVIDISQTKLTNFIEKVLLEIENENTNCFSPIWLYIIISYLRIKDNNIILKVDNNNILKESKGFEVIMKNISTLEDVLGIKYSESEVLLLVEYVQGLVSYKVNGQLYENWVDIILAVKELVNKVSIYTKLDLIDDNILLDGLLNHLKPAIYRLKNNINLENDIYMDVIEPYPELFNLIKKELIELEMIIEKSIPDSEIALITLHILAAIERNKEFETKKKNILLVCGGGYGTSRIIANRINDMYNVKIVDLVAYSDFINYDTSELDLIVTTLNIAENENMNIPLVQISPFLTLTDQKNLGRYLRKAGYNMNKLTEIVDIVNKSAVVKDESELINELTKALFKKEINKTESRTRGLKDFISIDKVRIIDKVENWKESIIQSGNILIDSGDINKEYIEDIIKIAENYGVHFVIDNEIAIPHGDVEKNINNSSIGVLLIRESVEFSYGRKAKLFFIISAKTTKDHVKSIEEISKLSKNEEFIEALNTVNDVQALLKLILKY
ncbi:MAG: PTS sugar transporter subunit IIA [Clostridium sp.]